MRMIITKELELEPEELGFLLDKKPDSKDVKAVFSAIEEELSKREIAKRSEVKVAEPVKEPEPVIEMKEEKKEELKKKPVEKKKNQASLFDF